MKIRDQRLAEVGKVERPRWLRCIGAGLRRDVATNCVSVPGTHIALEPSLDGEEPTAFKAVVLS